MTNRMHTRLTRLEAKKPTTALVWKDFGQTEEEAIAAWRAARPGEEPDKIYVLRWMEPQEGNK
jgi:hypothetical protein